MQAVLLVGGQGTRLRPLTYRLPKPLIPVLERPLLEYTVASLPSEVTELFVPISYMREEMERYLSSHRYPVTLTLVDEPEPLGTGGAVGALREQLRGPFFVLNGDVISSVNLPQMLRFHRERKAVGTISLWPVQEVSAFGIAEVDERGRILRFQEKPRPEEAFSNLINAGHYLLEPSVLDLIRPGFVSMEREVFPQLLAEGLFGYRFEGYWADCGTREGMLAATMGLLARSGPRVADRATIEHCQILQPIQISKKAELRHCRLGPNVFIGPEAIVMEGTVIRNSIVYERAEIGRGCTIVDSIIDAGHRVPNNQRIEGQIVGTDRPSGVA